MSLNIVILLSGLLLLRESAVVTPLDCDYQLVESIPEGVVFPPHSVSNSTFDILLALVNNAKQSLYVSSFYWTLLCEDVLKHTGGHCENGETLLYAIAKASKIRKVSVRIAVNDDRTDEIRLSSQKDIKILIDAGVSIRFVNFTRLVGAGVLHTKFLIADESTLYIGSSNMDWRSLTQVKELGVEVKNCQRIAEDLKKVFEVYWYLGNSSSVIPPQWPSYLSTKINKETPLHVSLGENTAEVYISSSPKQLNPDGRTNDIDAILDVINKAEKFVYIAVMDYSPTFAFSWPEKYWPVIDDALKRAAIDRKVEVKLLASYWEHTEKNMLVFLKSLDAFYMYKYSGRIEVKLFEVPPLPDLKIPFGRVNHNKYMVTDQTAYIGTSNWSADYFINTGGVAFVANCSNNLSNVELNIRQKLEKIFQRDWYSQYTHYVK